MLSTAVRTYRGASPRSFSGSRWTRWGATTTVTRSFRVTLPRQVDQDSEGPLSTQQRQVWMERLGKGVGQVIFLNSSHAGGILLASLAVGDPTLAALAGVGTALSTATGAVTCPPYQPSFEAGLLAYNGCLIGCAAGGFLVPMYGAAAATAWTVLLAPTTTALSLVLPKMLPTATPQWTWAFNAVALSQLVHLQPLAAAATVAEPLAPSVAALAVAPLVGLAQIFVVPSAWTGAGVALAVASYSPLLALHAVLGSTVGCLTGGLLLGGPLDAVAAGLYGYNAALTSMAVGVFLVDTRATWALSAAGALATTGVHAGLAALLGTIGSPCLTAPFCIVATGCHMLAAEQTFSGLALAANPHSPEQNKSA